MVLWRPTKTSRTNIHIQNILCITGYLECKSPKLRYTHNNRQFGLRVQNEAGQRLRILPRECTGHRKYPLSTTQEKTLHMDTTRWSILKSDWLYYLQPKIENSIQSAKTRPGANCGSDHELLIEKFWIKLKKVEKTTRPFRYDLNQIPYDYTLEMTRRFKGLHVIEFLKSYGQRFITLYRRLWPKPSPRNRNKKGKWLSEKK